ncbi:hypothetical protein G6F37_012347 [Rhizopus arrhizus]|nr:hypothetical protein G6F38_012257 [Rhizopus arrhizus]KAG1144110.1 hypothetical protein G6F37_012347 [Rhizopus arrhizus]
METTNNSQLAIVCHISRLPNPVGFTTETVETQNHALSGIIKISPTPNTQNLSNFFTIQEKTKRRPILDCQILNKFVQCHHFKMEGVPALRDLIEPKDFMCKIDLKTSYVVVPIHPSSRPYL